MCMISGMFHAKDFENDVADFISKLRYNPLTLYLSYFISATNLQDAKTNKMAARKEKHTKEYCLSPEKARDHNKQMPPC